jgi:hypothetical protein
MSSADYDSVRRLLAFLGAHRQWAYLVLFLGAYFETVAPFSLFVLGEAFFPGDTQSTGFRRAHEASWRMADRYLASIRGSSIEPWWWI